MRLRPRQSIRTPGSPSLARPIKPPNSASPRRAWPRVGRVLAGLVLNSALGWWWADPLAGLVIVSYELKEGRAAWLGEE